MIATKQPVRDFQGGLKAAAAAEEPEARLSKLMSLAAAGTSYIETIQLDRALTALRLADPPAAATRVRLAVLGTSTLDHLLPAIRVAGLRRQLLIDVHAGSFGQYRQELLSPESPVHAFRPTMLLLSLTADELLSDVPVSASKDAADRFVQAAVDELRALWAKARETFGAVLIQQSILDVTLPLFGNHERLIPGAPARLVARLNDVLADAAAEDGILFLDVAGASARDGIDAWFDRRHWLQGKLQIAPAAANRYGELLSRLIGASLGRAKKCLVLDLDNTLWGGVLGDDGLEGIKLGQGSAIGEAHLALQKYARQLKERGVILAVCSKNDWANVEQVFDTHPEMWLRRSDISAFAVNWTDKAENLQTIARTLNLGLDSLVFVDDNPAERERISASLPMVAVPSLSDDPAGYVSAIAEAGYFEATALTDEDRERAAQYAANVSRDALKSSAQSVDEFLGGLQMQVVYGRVTGVDLVRAGQLINKTNQFNTTTTRLSSAELERWAADPTALVLQFRLIDRFGDNGMVSVMLFREVHERRGTLELANWVMSCRVFGRQLEHEAMNIAVEAARELGVDAMVATFVPTAKNGVVSDLYGRLGFQCADQKGERGATSWKLDLAAYKVHPTRIARRART